MTELIEKSKSGLQIRPAGRYPNADKAGKAGKKIVLLSPPYRPGYMRNARCDFVSWSGCQWYPILLGYLGAYLESLGHTVKIIDAPAYGLDYATVVTQVFLFGPDYICIYAGNESFEQDMELADTFNDVGWPTKLIGPFYALNADRYHIPGIQGCLEDGVRSWIENAVDPEKPIVGEHSKIDLDAIPFVSNFYSRHLDSRYYVAPSEPYPFVDILTGRGCGWGKCSFCLWPQVYKKGYTTRSIKNVIDEVEYIELQTKFKSIMIEDDTFPEWRIDEFCRHKLKRNLRIPWSCLVRAELPLHILESMKRAGCLNVHVGYESGNDETLLRVNKGLTVARMERFTRDAKTAGLNIHGDFLIGIDDTVDGIYRTINWACTLRPRTAQFQIYIPFFKKLCPGKFSDESLSRLARHAYRKFYGSPRSWPAVIRQFGKPRILARSVRSVLK